jgi:hypothetical protein
LHSLKPFCASPTPALRLPKLQSPEHTPHTSTTRLRPHPACALLESPRHPAARA